MNLSTNRLAAGASIVAGLTAGLFISLVGPSQAALAQDSVTVSGQVSVDQCPDGYQYSTGLIVNVTTHEVFTQCNAPLNSDDIRRQQNDTDFYNAIQAAQADAQAQSEAWNAAHPGQQKCFQYGPITNANGGESSGGVCANVVAAPSTPSVDVHPNATPADPSVDAHVATPTIEVHDTVAPSPDSITSSPALATPSGIGGWALVNANNQVQENDVCTYDVCGDPASTYVVARNLPAGSRFVFFAPADSSGNVAGWGTGSYDPSTNTFAYGNCTHVGGTPQSSIVCAAAPALPATVATSSVRTTDVGAGAAASVPSPLDTSQQPTAVARPEITTDSRPAAEPTGLTPAPALVAIPDAYAGSNASPTQNSSVSDDVRQAVTQSAISLDSRQEGLPVASVTQDARNTAPTDPNQSFTVASLVKSISVLPKTASQTTVKLPVIALKLASKSLTPTVCSISSTGIKQLHAGSCKIAFSVDMGGGVKLTTTKTIKFTKRG